MILENPSAFVLIQGQSNIMSEWERRVEESVPTSGKRAKRALQDHLPELLIQLGEALSKTSNDGKIYSEGPTAKHANQARISSDYTLDQILKEYQVFHDIILETLEQAECLKAGELGTIQTSIHRAIQAAAADFVQTRYVEDLEKEKDFLGAVLDNLSDGIVACNAEGVLTLFNKATREFHGIPEAPIPADRWAEHYNLYKGDGVTPLNISEIPLFLALKGETVRDVEMVIAPKDGQIRSLLASGRALKDRDENIIGAVVAMKDMTAVRAAERAKIALEVEKVRQIASHEAERVTTQIFERISDAFFALDRDWRFVYVNRQMEAMGRKPAAELIGRTIWETFPEIVGSIFEKEYRRSVELETSANFEAYFPPFESWFSVKTHGSREGLSVYFADVTELRKAREERIMSEEWLKATLVSIGDAVIATDVNTDGSIVFMNQVAEKLTGWRLSEARGRPILEIFNIINQKTRKRAINPVDRVIAEGIVVGLANHTALISKTGQEYIIEDSAAPVRGLDGSLMGVVLVFRDATEEHRLRNRANILAQVVESTPSFIGVANPDGSAYFVNKAGRHLVGLPNMEAVAKTRLIDYFAAEEKLRVESEILPTVVSNGHWDGEVVFQKFDTGEKIPVSWNVFSMTDNDTGELKAIACVSTDLREKKKLEHEKEEASKKVEVERGRLYDLFEQTPIPICVLRGPEHIFTLANPAYRNLLGGNRDVLGKTVRQALPEVESQAFPLLLDEVYKTAVPFRGVEVPIKLIQADGSSKDFHLNFIYQPMVDASGFVEGIIVIVQDVSDQVNARMAIRESEHQFRQLADSMPQLVWTANPSGELNYVNQGFVDFTGLGAEIICDWTSADFVHPDDLKGTTEAWAAATVDQEFYEYEVRFRRADGQYRWVLSRAIASKDESGKIVKWFGSSTDIHEQKRLTQELELQRISADNASKAKSAFLANMSHEIRTPLGAILGFSEFLLEPDQTPSDRYDCVSTIRRNADQLFRLINELLDLSKIEADRLEIEHVRFKLEEVIQDVHQLLIVQAREKGIGLNFIAVGPLQQSIITDPTRLRQILVNVVGNAIKFTESGTVDVSIAMEQPDDQSQQIRLIFTVRDTGIGLSEEQSHKIWEPFAQADTSTTRKFGGTGLGLSLSKRLSLALGGDLTLISSVPGKGSTFKITIEAGPVESFSFVSDHSSTMAEMKNVAEEPAFHLLDGIKILVVEDSSDNQHLIKRFLVREGATVTIAGDGKEGVEKALLGSYAVVLMDVQMPVLDGYAAAARLLSQGYSVPIIALTAHAMRGERERAIAHGFFDHLTKPLDRVALLEKISAALQQTAFQGDIDLSVADDPEIKAIVEAFRLETFPELLRSIRGAVEGSDWKEVERIAHVIKGSVIHYISPRISVVASKMEREAKEGARLDILRALVSSLEKMPLHRDSKARGSPPLFRA